MSDSLRHSAHPMLRIGAAWVTNPKIPAPGSAINCLALGPVSRILFPPARAGVRRSFLLRPPSLLSGLRRAYPPSLRSRRAGAASADATYPRLSDGPPSLLFCLAPEGVFRAARLAAERGGLLPHLFTLTRLRSFRSSGGRYILCDTFRRRGLNRGACACPAARAASCPMVSGLSSPNCNERGG